MPAADVHSLWLLQVDYFGHHWADTILEVASTTKVVDSGIPLAGADDKR